MNGLFWRALVAFLALPVTVAALVPWLLLPERRRFDPTGLPLMVGGALLLLWCVRMFYVAGRGTLAPWAPPVHLVSTGPYRVSRNPMYIAVLALVAGWAVAFSSPVLYVYTAFLAVAFHLRVVSYEEPWLATKHGAAWFLYRARVPRWVGRRRAGTRVTGDLRAVSSTSTPTDGS